MTLKVLPAQKVHVPTRKYMFQPESIKRVTNALGGPASQGPKPPKQCTSVYFFLMDSLKFDSHAASQVLENFISTGPTPHLIHSVETSLDQALFEAQPSGPVSDLLGN